MTDAATAGKRFGGTIDLLRRSETFAGLSDDDLAAVAAISRECEAQPGAIVFQEGEPAGSLCVLIEGRIALERAIVLGRKSGARRATVETFNAGDVFGLSATVPPYVMTATGVCLERSVYLAIDAATLRQVTEERPALGRELMSRVARLTLARLNNTTHRLTYLLSIASHDLKAPLAAVESYLQVMLGGYVGPVSERQHQMLVRCSERVTEALDLVSNFLDMSRLETGQMYNEMEVVSITNVVRRALDVARPTAQDKGVQLESDCPNDVPGIHAAALRLQQALVNLLSNAIKFTPAGGRVSLRLEDSAEQILIEIADTGIGIPAEDLPYIFDDFYRGGNAGEAAGTGLGLPVAKRIVLAHGGRIWAESGPDTGAGGSGSRFVITLPRRPAHWPSKPSC